MNDHSSISAREAAVRLVVAYSIIPFRSDEDLVVYEYD